VTVGAQGKQNAPHRALLVNKAQDLGTIEQGLARRGPA
jgi:hypothetical protein